MPFSETVKVSLTPTPAYLSTYFTVGLVSAIEMIS
jgi:hypothetical protein